MDYSVYFSSETGNTAMLADALEKNLAPHRCAEKGRCCDAAPRTDVVFVGFWTDRENCDPDSKALLQRLAGKKVFLFGTAGFGSSDYFESLLKKAIAEAASGIHFIGGYMCQGKMPLSVRERYAAKQAETPDDPRWQVQLDNFDKALSHPDEEDLAALCAAAKKALDEQEA